LAFSHQDLAKDKKQQTTHKATSKRLDKSQELMMKFRLKRRPDA
jgi:hypothetical protein